MALLLRTENYSVSSAANASEALELVSGGLTPDVVVVDFNIEPHMNGAEVAEEISRRLCYTPPLIMLTGNLQAARIPRGTGVLVWMTGKPLNPQWLLTTLPYLVQISRATRHFTKSLVLRSAPHHETDG
jgi:CheY-like chemotaxis protein